MQVWKTLCEKTETTAKQSKQNTDDYTDSRVERLANNLQLSMRKHHYDPKPVKQKASQKPTKTKQPSKAKKKSAKVQDVGNYEQLEASLSQFFEFVKSIEEANKKVFLTRKFNFIHNYDIFVMLQELSTCSIVIKDMVCRM